MLNCFTSSNQNPLVRTCNHDGTTRIGNNYFGVILTDDIILGDSPGIGQLMHIAYKEHASVIAVQEVPQNKISSYGVIAIKEQITHDLEIDHMVEKPSADQAPSNLAIIGRYILSPKIFESLEQLYRNHGDGGLQLTHAIDMMMKTNKKKCMPIKSKELVMTLEPPKVGCRQLLI